MKPTTLLHTATHGSEMAIRQVIDDAAFPPFNTRSEAPILPAHIAG